MNSKVDFNDIAAMLASGTSSNDIAKMFAEALNSAVKEKAAADKAARQEDSFIKELVDTFEEFKEYAQAKYPYTYALFTSSDKKNILTQLEATEFALASVETFNEAIKTGNVKETLDKLCDSLLNQTKAPVKNSAAKSDPLVDFLKKNNLF